MASQTPPVAIPAVNSTSTSPPATSPSLPGDPTTPRRSGRARFASTKATDPDNIYATPHRPSTITSPPEQPIPLSADDGNENAGMFIFFEHSHIEAHSLLLFSSFLRTYNSQEAQG